MNASPNTLTIPRLPAEFHRKSPIGAVGLIVYMLSLFTVPTILNYYIIMYSNLSLTWQVVLCAPLFLLSGQSFHLMGWIGHDGFHFTLHKNRYVSAMLALIFSSMTIIFFEIGMAMDHWSHHRFANTGKDPDFRLLGYYKTFLARLFLQRSRANQHYFKRAMSLAFGRPLAPELLNIKLPFPLIAFRIMAWINIALVVSWLWVYITINHYFPNFLWIGIIVPGLIGTMLSGLRSFMEHSDTAVGDYLDTRSRTHWLFTVIEYGGNYHLEHHLYPAIPQWRLPKVHHWLKENGYFNNLPDTSVLDPSLAVYRYAGSRYEYGRKTTNTHSPAQKIMVPSH
jgi:beta-carotene hydroxylase